MGPKDARIPGAEEKAPEDSEQCHGLKIRKPGVLGRAFNAFLRLLLVAFWFTSAVLQYYVWRLFSVQRYAGYPDYSIPEEGYHGTEALVRLPELLFMGLFQPVLSPYSIYILSLPACLLATFGLLVSHALRRRTTDHESGDLFVVAFLFLLASFVPAVLRIMSV